MQLLGTWGLVLPALLVLGATGPADGSAYDKILTHSRIRARTQGPNVCAVQRLMGTNRKYFSTCRNWYQGAICGKKAEVMYECCPGYMKLDGMKGCPAVAPIDHIYGTLALVQAWTTQRYADRADLRAELEGGGSYTIFVPSDEAWERLAPSARSALVSNVNDELRNLLHYHMVERRLLTKDLKDGQVLRSMFNQMGLYINHYSNGVVTVNCARIVHGNQVATNGVVHVIDGVVSAVGSSIWDTLDTLPQLSQFKTVVEASDLTQTLDQAGHYTLFAPTNAAFEKLEPGYLRRVLNDKAVVSALAKYHLLSSVQCSDAIMAGAVYETAEGGSIEIGCNGDSLTVNGIKMVLKKDIVATNGVIHLIDQVLVPNAAKEVRELLGETQTRFRDMMSELDLASALGTKTEYTLLAPINSAFTTEVTTMKKSLLRTILENHLLKLKVSLSQLYNGQLLETLAGKLLRVFIYRTAVCIENSCMVRGSKEGSNGALHLMRSLISPPDKSIYQILVSDGRFKVFLSLMETAGLTDLLRQEGSYTIFAPTDEAFGGVSKEELSVLKSDVNALRTILLYHFSNGVFINGGLEGGVTNLLRTLQGSNLQVISVNNSIHVNNVDVPTSDLMATNGVVHVVKNILYPVDLPVGRQDLLVLLKKLIRYIKIKFVSGYSYTEIPLTFIRRTVTTTEYTQTGPGVQKVVRVIGGEPSVTKVTRVIEGEPSITKVTRVIDGEPSVTKVTRVIGTEPKDAKVAVEGDPSVTKVTRVIETEPTIAKVVVDGEPSVTKVTRVISGEPSITKVTRVIDGEPSVSKVTRVIGTEPKDAKVAVDGDPSVIKVTRVIETEPKVTMVVVDGEPSVTKVTRVIAGEPSITKVTRVIEGKTVGADGKWVPDGTRGGMLNEPHIIEVPDFPQITTIHGNPRHIEEESERITKIIQEGGKFAAARKIPAGMRRRARPVRRHYRPRQPAQ